MSDRKIRICYALNSFEIGGAEVVALDLARSHDPERYEVEVVALIEPSATGESVMRARFQEAGVKTNIIQQAKYRSPIALWRIFKYLRKGNFDIIHGHNRGADFWAARLGILAGIPHRFWTRHLVYQDFSGKQLRRYASVSKRINKVIAVSETVREACIETEGIAADRVVTIVNGIDTSKFAPLSAADRDRKRAEWGLQDGERALLFVGRFNEQKAPEAFVNLVWNLRAAGHAVKGFMCGYGPLADSLQAMASNGPTGVEILGMRSDIPELLGACDLFVSTSRNEGLPLNVMEAMATGAPFVGPAIPQVGELVAGNSDLESCLYSAPPQAGPVPVGQTDEWAQKVVELLQDEDQLKAVGRAGRRTIEERFSLGRMVKSYEALFEEATVEDLV